MSSNEESCRRRRRRGSRAESDDASQPEKRPSSDRRHRRHRNYSPTPKDSPASGAREPDRARRSHRNYSRTESQNYGRTESGSSSRYDELRRHRNYSPTPTDSPASGATERDRQRRRHRNYSPTDSPNQAGTESDPSSQYEQGDWRRDQNMCLPMGAASRDLWGLENPYHRPRSNDQRRPGQPQPPYSAALMSIYDRPEQECVRESLRRGPPPATALGGAAFTGFEQGRRRPTAPQARSGSGRSQRSVYEHDESEERRFGRECHDRRNTFEAQQTQRTQRRRDEYAESEDRRSGRGPNRRRNTSESQQIQRMQAEIQQIRLRDHERQGGRAYPQNVEQADDGSYHSSRETGNQSGDSISSEEMFYQRTELDRLRAGEGWRREAEQRAWRSTTPVIEEMEEGTGRHPSHPGWVHRRAHPNGFPPVEEDDEDTEDEE